MEPEPPKTPSTGKPGAGLSARDQYNLVSDTIVGVNVRWRDNLVQAVVILVFAILGAGVGWTYDEEQPVFGALAGCVAGLIAGVILSGTALMIFRFVRHVRGRHD